jgi:UDP-3-O-[3-hydroxymyristoyl] glucosamine N-acyltransferase
VALLKSSDPYYTFARAVVALLGHRKHAYHGVHPDARVDPSAQVGSNTVIYPGAFVGPRAKIAHEGQHFKIPQIGNVMIEDDVEIGAGCCIARAALGSTVVGRGTKIDSQVMVGHNTRIGPHGLLVAQVGLAGSVTIGHHATIAGQVGVAGHLKIGDNVTIAAKSGVMDDIPDQATVMGVPAMSAQQARRVYTIFQQLPALVERLKQIEQEVQELSDSGDTPLV